MSYKCKYYIFTITTLFAYISGMAQTDVYHISGKVFSQHKFPVIAASVRFPELKKNIVTDSSGRFSLSDMPAGTYTIIISATGYITLKSKIVVTKRAQNFSFLLKTRTALLNDVSVFGYSRIKSLNRQAYNVTAIDAQKLQNTVTDVAHVLDHVPGARLRETGGLGSDYDFSISGFSGNRIKFFLDGIPMESFGPSFQINNIPVNLAERIEVYKGVVPVWLGGDALGGAVNIVTNNRLKNYLDVSYSYGSFNTHRTNINAGYTSKKGFTVRLNAFQNYSDNDYKVTVDAADIHTGQYYRDTTVKRFHDKYHNETAIAQIGFTDKKWTDQLLFGITLGQYYKQIQTGARSTAVFGAWFTKGNIIMPALKYAKKNFITKGLDVTFNADYNLGQDQSIDTIHARYNWLGDSITYLGKGGESWYSLYKYRNHNGSASLSAKYSINGRQNIAFDNVFSYFNRKGANLVSPNPLVDNIPQKTEKNILGASYQYHIPGKFNITVFGKYFYQHASTTLIQTDYNNPGDTVYNKTGLNRNKPGYGVAATYFIQPQLQLKFSYEKTYRMPESEDLFGDIINKDGNWNLKPERSNNINLGLGYNLNLDKHHFYFSGTGIYYYAKDFIYYNPLGPNPNKLYPDNLYNVSNLGLESEIRYSYQQIFVAGINVTYQNLRDRNKYRTDLPDIPSITYKERIPNIPYLFGNVHAALYFPNIFSGAGKLTIGYNMMYVHNFYLYWASEGAADTKRMIPTQISHDVSIVYTFKNGRYNTAIECKNIIGEKLYDNYSLQKPGRSFSIKLRYFIGQ
ncbi:hypothetical protein A9P82_01715 [Arachidicoccus ginsenosidimutans]|uniref:TonB-dependent receptor n=1 Tax=Arachidicoccus sp. BS20 TaxID=1850526 RepID=UPI0007F0DD21|nr:TonB-dependent receptor [Arachidicoccus sp. BS20]ANI88139.1 hypothetical protein A9P82_01715 [Arachidicoccus sp. BS20]